MRKLRSILVSGILLTFIFLLAACGGGNDSQAVSADAPNQTSPSIATEPSATPTPTLTATGLIQAFIDAGLPLIHVIEFTSATDPNSLLGRPGEYTEKINWFDERYFESWMDVESPDLTVEVFRSRADMERRRDYIQSIIDAMPILGRQYFFYSDTLLLRLPFDLTPESAAQYEEVFHAFLIGETVVLDIAPVTSNAENSTSPSDTAQPTPQAPSQPVAPQAGEIMFEITSTQEHFFEHRANEFTYQTLIQITNTGSVPIYFGTSRFDLTDENDRILSANNTFSARPTILHAGERGYLWASERITGATANTEVTLVPRWDMSRSIHYRPNLELVDIEIRENPNRFIDNLIVFGRIINNTDSEISRADISVVLYAYDGTPIGVWTTTARDLPAGASFGFEATSSNTIFENLTVEMVGEFTAFAVDFWQRNR